jgi:ubiquitin carboxyl-terminal hydrolase 9/24
MFFSLNVTVKNATLQDSLDQFVKGELLEGSNAYFCEKCGVKVCIAFAFQLFATETIL